MTQLTQATIEEAFKNEDKFNELATQIANDVSDKNYDILHFVEALGFALTATVVDVRVNGTRLLSAVLAQLTAKLLTAKQLEFLSSFYADRLKDQHNVIPAVIDGITALIAMQQLSDDSVSLLLQSFFRHTSCQSQTRSDRAKLFRIFRQLSEQHAPALKAMSGDFIYGLINSIDGERDPRNLDFIFSFMPAFISSYPLLHLSEEMFEIFACYFPIDFNASSNDPASITRDALAAKLINCLVASSDFVEWTVALALEKLDSDLTVAKLDSLQLLQQSALKFAPTLLQSHFTQLWTALKTEVLPGTDNSDVQGAALLALRSLLEQAAAADASISHSYQTSILGTILTHLSDTSHRLFQPASAIALVCVAGDARFAAEKLLSCLQLQLQSTEKLNTAQRIQIYAFAAQVFKISSMREALEPLAESVACQELLAHLIEVVGCDEVVINLELLRAAFSALNECVPCLSETQRALLYKALLQHLTSTQQELEFKFLLEQLGALHPIELQAHCLDICIRDFATYSANIQRKIYAHLLPLIKQMAFAQRILQLILSNVFGKTTTDVVRLLALEALNELLRQEDQHFIVELQNNSCLIDKLVKLMQDEQPHSAQTLAQAATSLSLVCQQLPVAEQYMIVSEYLPQLQLQRQHDLFVAQGLLGYLHKDISLDDHFERLLSDLSQLALSSTTDEPLRLAANHLLCSLVNKIDYKQSGNKSTIRSLIERLKAALHAEQHHAVTVLAWLGKALIMRDCAEATEIIETLTALLDHPTLTHTAQLAFEILAVECPQLHLPIVKFLYKQKFFHTVLAKLGSKLEACCAHHLNAFVFVLKTTPHAVLRMNLPQVAPLLFKCLEQTTQTHTLCSALHICESFIGQQDEYFRSHLTHIIPRCVQLSQNPQSMQVRITALKLLHDITKYPAYALLPFKMDVVLELAPALDDRKRLVRNAAVTARNAWYLLGAPSAE